MQMRMMSLVGAFAFRDLLDDFFQRPTGKTLGFGCNTIAVQHAKLCKQPY
jgi:hypothetical protein